MSTKGKKGIDYSDPKIRKDILVRQRREMWTPEQVAGFAKYFGLKPGMKLLDAGCGYGYSLRTFGLYCMPGGSLVGVDIEKTLLKTACRLAKKEGLTKSTFFQQGDIYNLPFNCNTFDIAIAQVVLCHLDKPEQALDELIRVTRRGGCIAVFDNAVGGGSESGWDNLSKWTIKQKLFYYEMSLRTKRGKKKQKTGDFAVGCYVPGWMEQRGLKNVNVRQNERVYWIAPPYRSPNQKTVLRNRKEEYAEWKPGSPAYRQAIKKTVEILHAGGADNKMIRRYIRLGRRLFKRHRKALTDGTLAFSYSGPFWCIWGFKP